MPPTPDDVLTTDQIRDLKGVAADTSSRDLMRETARRVLADPTRSRQAYADDLRAALKRIDESTPADVMQEDIENDVRQAYEEVRRERLRQHAEQRTGTA